MLGNNSHLRLLITYYGLLQSAHGVVLLRAGLILLRGGEMPFPALPPVGGWSPQTLPFLIGMGVMDGVNILLALTFSTAYLWGGRLQERLGIVTLTVACASALSFAVATGLTGAWLAHPLAYGLMGALFVPVAWLFVVLLRRN